MGKQGLVAAKKILNVQGRTWKRSNGLVVCDTSQALAAATDERPAGLGSSDRRAAHIGDGRVPIISDKLPSAMQPYRKALVRQGRHVLAHRGAQERVALISLLLFLDRRHRRPRDASCRAAGQTRAPSTAWSA
eukprot:TRINITY_DN114_c0_g1_i9.p1 TRINITY_DN114_c0_g1~~TRINITY_DN114_c0_g1_i9.p1  ORF type:complete len:133 (+),score=4.67 TRINITY_DN114_c0_g1_i9:606-1004(+)